MWLFLALHECVFCVSAQTQNTPNVSQKKKGKRTKFVLCKSNLSLEREEKKKRPTKQPKQGMCHNVALPFTSKKYLKAKRRIMETQIFHHAKIY
jgi:hypothetical protein